MSVNYEQPISHEAPMPVSQDERNFAALTHLGGLVAAFFGLGFVPALVVYLGLSEGKPFLRENAKENLNFHITLMIAGLISLVLSLILIGLFMLVALAVMLVVFSIMAAVKASEGQVYRFPMTLRLVK